MTPTTIKDARKKHDITQVELAEKLDLSRNVVIAIEKGDRELSVSEARKISDFLGVKVEMLLVDQLPDFSKYKEMALQMLSLIDDDGKVPKTKLAKLLYLSDFVWYAKELVSMSGMSYRKSHYGPVSDEYFRILEELELENLIDIEIKETEGGYKTHLISLTEGGKRATTNNISKKESKLMKSIAMKWRDKKTSEIVGFTHQQLPFKLADDGEIISYALITQVERKDLY